MIIPASQLLRPFLVLVLIARFTAVSGGYSQAQSVGQPADQPFSITITNAHARIKTESAIVVKVTLKNVSNRVIMIRYSRTVCDYVVEVRDGIAKLATVTQDKRALRCWKLQRTAFMWLTPKESTEEEIAASRLLNMSQPGDYYVQVMRKAPKEFRGLGEIEVSKSLKITVTL
jgi:hypothetical protein